MSNREDEVERICQAALDRPRTERERFVSEVCRGDEVLRRDVASRLAYADAASRFLESPALDIAAQALAGHRTLSAGQRIGAYVITSSIGAGGMGEVYRARDSALGREVAIKVLPSIFSSDPERLARFEREARVLAALNHPNIATIHGVERVDSGAEPAGIHAIVLELVEGDTLADRVATRGALPWSEALGIARQIAEGLEAAHDKDIVHRDLKPANIKVRPDGVVKVLDFGLAKALSPADTGRHQPDLSHSPTVGRTSEGVLLGTASYMSPEQARGRVVDKRTDIWAFGCVLFEMLTGRVAFQRGTVTDTFAAVVDHEPDWTALPTATPHTVTRLLRRCLEKDPRRRLHDIADARIELDDATVTPGSAMSVPVASRRRSLAAWFAGSALVAGGLGAMLAFALRQQPETPATDLAVTIEPGASGIARVTSGAGLAIPKISPDGSFVAYYDPSNTLQLRPLNSLLSQPVPGLNGAWFVWSRDSRFLLFVDGSTLKRVRVPDGAPETVGPAPTASPAAALGGVSESGAMLFMRPEFSMLFAPRAGAEATEIRVPGLTDGSYGSVSSLPAGEDFLLSFLPRGSDQNDIYLVTLREGSLVDPALLVSNVIMPLYTPAGGGQILYVRNGSLYSQTLNRKTRRLEGDAQLIQRGVASGGTPGTLAAFSVSDSGTVAWRPGRETLAQVTIFDRRGTPVGTAGPPASTGALKLSPDEQHLLLAERNGRAWLLEPNQPGRHDLGQGHISMAWSGAVDVLVPEESRVVAHPLTRPKEGHELIRVPGLVRLEDVSVDGALMLFRTGSWSDLFSVRLDGRPEDRIAQTVQTGKLISNVRISPDGRWLVYQGDGPGYEVGVYVQPFPGPALPQQIASSGESPVWGKDGKEIVYLDQDQVWSIPVETSNGRFRAGRPEAMFAVRSMEGGRRVRGISQLAISRDGSRIYYQQPVEQPPESNLIRLKVGSIR